MKTTNGAEIKDLRIAPVKIINSEGLDPFSTTEVWRLSIRLESDEVLETVVTEIDFSAEETITIEATVDEAPEGIEPETLDAIENRETNQGDN